MFNPENYFYDVKEKSPQENQRVIAFNSKLDDFIDAVFKDGRFYENDNELANITKWKERSNNIEI